MDIHFLADKVKQHGEIHIVVEEHDQVAGDDYIGLRKGNTEFFPQDELIRVDDGTTEHYIDSESVIYANKPVSFPD